MYYTHTATNTNSSNNHTSEETNIKSPPATAQQFLGPQSPFDPFEPSPKSIEFKSKMQEQDPEEFFFEAHMTLAPMPDMPPPSPPAAAVAVVPTTSSIFSGSDTTTTTTRYSAEHLYKQNNQEDQDHEYSNVYTRSSKSSTMPAGQIASESIENTSTTSIHSSSFSTTNATPTIALIDAENKKMDKKSKKSKKKKSKKKSSSEDTGTSSKEKRKSGSGGGRKNGRDKSTSKGSGSGSGGKYYSQYSNMSQHQKEEDGYYGDDHSEEENKGSSSLLSFCRPKKASTSTSLPKHGNALWNDRDAHAMPTPKIGKQMSSSKNKQQPQRPPLPPTTGASRLWAPSSNRINTGELNSAAGEGTTVPEILSKIRFWTISLSGLTIILESYAIVFNTLFLQAPMVILGVYLLFFIALLILFEVVRGDPVPTSSVAGGGGGGLLLVKAAVGGSGGGGINASQVAELAWTIVLERKWARRTRYFLQNNFGMLYSCVGRGIYLCFVGSVAVGQNFILIQVLGLGFILMGLWTISLSCRFPLLEKAMIMNLEDEFGDVRDDASIGGSSVVTWSSIPSSIRSDETRSLLNHHNKSVSSR